MKRFSNILFVANFNESDAMAFEQAAKLALANQAKLTVVGVLSDYMSSAVVAYDLLASLSKQRQEQLLKLVNSASKNGLDAEVKVLSGRPSIEIIQEALTFDHDLLIKPINHDESIGVSIFGSTDMKLLRKCPCPIWMIKSAKQVQDKEILVGLDYEPDNPENDELNMRIMNTAISIALAELCELHIVHAWRLENESFLRSARTRISDSEVDNLVKAEATLRENWLSELVDQCLAAHGQETKQYLEPQLHVVKGRASNVVPAVAKELSAELIVMGTIARTGIPGYLIGNTAETILNRINSSVLAIKPRGFISPIKPRES